MKVCVLLATKDGELYLEKQLDSILNQTISVNILASDDGSSDGTKEILVKHQITSVSGPCQGPSMNFFSLIHRAPKCEFYAFSDQDDVWDLDKVAKGIESIREIDGPALYVGSVRKQSGRKLIPRTNKYVGFILSNSSMGCTMMFNRELLDLVKKQENLNDTVLMHDWWLHIYASVVGVVVYDKNPCMTYRIHPHNNVGVPSTFKRLKRFVFFITHLGSRRDTILQYRAVQRSLPTRFLKNDRFADDIDKLSSTFRKRLEYISTNQVSENRVHNVALKMMILFGAFT